jgi:lipid A ethanolaminephosphotransferase
MHDPIAPPAPKPRSSILLTLVLSAWVIATCNTTFWREVWGIRGSGSFRDLAFLASLFVVTTLYANLWFSLLAFRWVGRAWLITISLVSAAVAYFASAFGTRLDAHMMRNVLETDARESAELLSPGLALRLLLIAGPPIALVLARRRFAFGTLREELGRKLRVVIVTAVVAAPIAGLFYADYASLMRNHRELRHVMVPANWLGGVLGWIGPAKAAGPPAVIGADAHRSAADVANPRPELLLLFVGETARAANFSLAGYGRETNPELAVADVICFPSVRASGTSTGVSLPSMFSNLGHGGSTEKRAKRQESLLDVLAHAGFGVVWRDNDSGCKGICDRVEYEDLAHEKDARLCPAGECFDEILLEGLQERLDRSNGDQVVVLHMHGSHGPGYHLRIPPEFAVFKPGCTSLELERCSHEELVNAYDNTIRYTDHVLAQAIELLRRNAARFDGAMIYVSDHGESLGEKGLYLHGMPEWMAPDEQTRVPMIVWVSPELRARRSLDWQEIAARREHPLSHDNLFHTVLGLLGVETEVYRPELDCLRPVVAR